MGTEIWRPVPGFSDYLVSDAGKVYSWRSNKILTPGISYNGYEFVVLRNKYKHKTWRVSRLVLFVFVGKSNKQVNHIDGNKRNNCINNLEYCSAKENIAHAWKTGLVNRYGENSTAAKLKLADIEKIKSEEGTITAIAKKYGVSRRTIKRVRDSVTWRNGNG